MIIKTYAIDGLSEWHGELRSGTISVKVSFTGGTASPSGALPAYFMTKDPVTQFVIENSHEFKSGLIRTDMQQQIAEPTTGNIQPTTGDVVTESDVVAESDVETEPTVISVISKGEAIEWLKEHYPDKGYNGFNLKGNAAFESACNEHNVVFDIQG